MDTTVDKAADTRRRTGHASPGRSNDRATLAAIARRAMIERGLEPDFPPKELQELAAIQRPAGAADGVRDLITFNEQPFELVNCRTLRGQQTL